MPLIGAVQEPITSAPLVIFIYLVLILMIAGALAGILLRSTLYAIGTFSATLALVALLYLTIAPFLLFAVQLLVFTTVSAALLIGLLRETSGIQESTVGPFSREWIIGAAVAAALLAVGAFATVARRSALTTLLGTQLMFAAGAIAFVAFGRFTVLSQTPAAAHENVAGVMALFVGAIAVAELAVGLALAAIIYRESRSFAVDADRG